MAHEAQRVFFQSMKEQFPKYFSNVKVIEVGSLNINGTVRDFFTNPVEYIGADLAEGPDVDVVCEGQDLAYDDNYFDTSISAECFEHNPYWLETFVNMHRMTKPGGLVTFSCATDGRPEHGTSRTDGWASPFTVEKGWGDYYRNLNQKDFDDALDLSSMFKNHEFLVHEGSHDLYFHGVKK
jgi:SAM-dependent methyltransferase